MLIGYARVSTKDQNLDLQLDALKNAGCEKIYTEVASGAKTDRPELQKLLENLRSGDSLIIWKLDRLGRSLKHLIDIITQLSDRGVGFKSIQDSFIDTTTSQGRLIFNIFASLAEFERDIIRERTKAGLESARARGRVGGRPKGLSEKAKQKAIVAETLYKEKTLSVREICKQLEISTATFYKYLRIRKIEPYSTL